MGKFSRSLSRVQPIFKALYEIDPSGESWVRSLLDMASGNDSFSSAISEISLGTLVKPPQFEFPVDPSKMYLKWLFEHPEILSSPPAKAWKSWATKTQAMRSRFLLGDKEVQTLAISNIEKCTSLPKTAWWRLEGATYVDCALLTDSAVIFVEGKITETGPSKEVIWYHERNQIHHKLDCAAVYAREEGLRHYFVIAIFDNELMQQGPFRRREVDALMSFDVISKSLPHLNNDELKEIARHFAGVTTWEEIIDRFGLRNRILPHPINHPY